MRKAQENLLEESERKITIGRRSGNTEIYLNNVECECV